MGALIPEEKRLVMLEGECRTQEKSLIAFIWDYWSYFINFLSAFQDIKIYLKGKFIVHGSLERYH